jgi:hypothetical protein
MSVPGVNNHNSALPSLSTFHDIRMAAAGTGLMALAV